MKMNIDKILWFIWGSMLFTSITLKIIGIYASPWWFVLMPVWLPIMVYCITYSILWLIWRAIHIGIHKK